MISLRRSHERGRADHGWLQSHHTFSFGSYYDPQHRGVSALRVINDDKVLPGQGFATHSHQDMEIISYVKQGVIEHKDSMGNTQQLPAGEFQLMSAGTGITHSEYNPSLSNSLEFMQIWIQPNELGIRPNYQQKAFEPQQGLQLIISPDGAGESLRIHQNAFLYQLKLHADETFSQSIAKDRTVYVHIVSGELSINDESLQEGDGATLTDLQNISFRGQSETEALVFDLP